MVVSLLIDLMSQLSQAAADYDYAKEQPKQVDQFCWKTLKIQSKECKKCNSPCRIWYSQQNDSSADGEGSTHYCNGHRMALMLHTYCSNRLP